jgi:hypothetical protein
MNKGFDMDKFKPVLTFIEKLCVASSPNSRTKHTKNWDMTAQSNTRDWTSFEITDTEKVSCAFCGNFDFWTKTLAIVESHDKKLENAIISAFRNIYTKEFSCKREHT